MRASRTAAFVILSAYAIYLTGPSLVVSAARMGTSVDGRGHRSGDRKVHVTPAPPSIDRFADIRLPLPFLLSARCFRGPGRRAASYSDDPREGASARPGNRPGRAT